MSNELQSRGKATISLDSIVVATREQISTDLGDETVILNLANGVYYGLSPEGAYIWKLIQEPICVRDVRDRLLEEYDVEPERCERELLVLLTDLEAAGLILVADT